MIKTKLEGLKYILEQSIPQFVGCGHINIRGREQAVNGIEDDIPNYFLIDYQNESEQLQIDKYDNSRAHFIKAELQILIKSDGLDKCSVMSTFLSCIYSSCNAVEDVTATQSVEFISEQFGYENPCDLDLTLIKFTETFAVSLMSNCKEIICKEESC